MLGCLVMFYLTLPTLISRHCVTVIKYLQFKTGAEILSHNCNPNLPQLLSNNVQKSNIECSMQFHRNQNKIHDNSKLKFHTKACIKHITRSQNTVPIQASQQDKFEHSSTRATVDFHVYCELLISNQVQSCFTGWKNGAQ